MGVPPASAGFFGALGDLDAKLPGVRTHGVEALNPRLAIEGVCANLLLMLLLLLLLLLLLVTVSESGSLVPSPSLLVLFHRREELPYI